jgi:hypothetical protein
VAAVEGPALAAGQQVRVKVKVKTKVKARAVDKDIVAEGGISGAADEAELRRRQMRLRPLEVKALPEMQMQMQIRQEGPRSLHLQRKRRRKLEEASTPTGFDDLTVAIRVM